MLLWEEEDPPRNVPIEGTDRPWKTLTLRQWEAEDKKPTEDAEDAEVTQVRKSGEASIVGRCVSINALILLFTKTQGVPPHWDGRSPLCKKRTLHQPESLKATQRERVTCCHSEKQPLIFTRKIMRWPTQHNGKRAQPFHTQWVLGSALAMIVFKMLLGSQASCARDFHVAQNHVRNFRLLSKDEELGCHWFSACQRGKLESTSISSVS